MRDFTFQLNAQSMPEVTIKGKKLYVYALNYCYLTADDSSQGILTVSVEGYIEGTVKPKVFLLDMINNTCTQAKEE